MITVVICSGSGDLLKKVKQNVLNTIGVPCEILAYDNSIEKKSICSVYNRGAQEAINGIICYMHEDIEIKTNDWGLKVIQVFQDDDKLGLLGVAGASYKSLAPSGWGHNNLPDKSIHHYNIIQGFRYQEKEEEYLYSNPRNEVLSKVVCLDGVWFCTRKLIALEFPFDEKLLNGFHGYDIDFSLSVIQKYSVAVTYDILIRHFSEGKFDESWWIATLNLHTKWSKNLPINLAGIHDTNMIKNERRMYKSALAAFFHCNLPFFLIYHVLNTAKQSRIMTSYLFLKLYAYAVKFHVSNLLRADRDNNKAC